ncbi:MAG: ATP-binding protein [Casimicrobiaceae bacterium]
MTIRTRLILLVVAVFIPITIAAVIGIVMQYARERAAVEQSMRETTRALALVVDREIGKREVIARMLADSPYLDSGDFVRFHQQARQAVAGSGAWVVLADRERQIVNTAVPFGTSLPIGAEDQSRVFDFVTEGAVLTGVTMGRLTQLPAASIRVPVRRDGQILYNVAVRIRPDELQQILKDQNAPAGWVSAIIDRDSRIIARVPNPERWVGSLATPDVRAAIERRSAGFIESVTLDGSRVIASYNTSPVYGWTSIMGAPKQVLGRSIERSLTELIGVAFAFLALAVLIAIWMGRRIAAPLTALSSTAASLERGEPVTPARTGIRECDDVSAALADASVRIRSASGELERRVADAVATTEQAQVQLAAGQRLEALGRLTGGVAHDFNNLLAVLNNNLFLLANRVDAPELAAMRRAVNTGVRLTRQLLAFSRRQSLQPQQLALDVQLPAIVELITSTLGRNIEIEVDIAPDLPAVEVDAAELELALINLAMNAKDAMPDGGTLSIRARASHADPDVEGGDAVAISVHDSGAGFAPEVLTRAFEPFFTTKPAGQGTGLGLSQVHGFCTQSGGKARIASTLGKGTTVTLVLPAARAGSAETGSTTPATGPIGNAAGRRVLLVDDNVELVAATTPVLQAFGFDVTTATSADDALRVLERTSIDVILSDVSMPGERNGLDLARSIRNDRPGLPIVLMTGYTTELQRAVAEGFTVLQKPCAPDTLAAVLRSAGPAANRDDRHAAAATDASGALPHDVQP